MRRTTKLMLFVVTALVACGCDYVRMLAGRPTSADIAAKKERIEMAELRKKAVADSLAEVQRRIKDSISVRELLEHQGRIHNARDLRNFRQTALKPGYYIILGAFSNLSNADNLRQSALDEGVDVIMIDCPSGLHVISVEPEQDLVSAGSRMNSVSGFPFFPKDAWILEVQ